MTRLPRRTALVPVLLAGAAAVTGLAGCGASRYNQNFQERSSIDTTNADLGTLELRNAYFSLPADPGSSAQLVFSLYSREAARPDELTSVVAPDLSDQPLQLQKVSGASATSVQTIPVTFQAGTGSNVYAARAVDVAKPMLPATYHKVTFNFSSRGPLQVLVPVRKIGEVQPGSSAVPTVIPDSPYPIDSALPGEQQPTTGPTSYAQPTGTPTP